MENMKLAYFTEDDAFPFFIHYGKHDEPLHLHGHEDFFELTVVLSGFATHIVGNDASQIKQGDVFVMGRDIVHGYDAPQHLRICNIMFRPETLLAADYDVKSLPGFHALFLLEPLLHSVQGFQSRLTLDAAQFQVLKQLIDTTIAEYDSHCPGRKTLLLSYFIEMVVLLSRFYDDWSMHQDVRDPGFHEITDIAAVAAFMEKHYAEPISICQLLSQSHYSRRHFIRLFTSAYQMPPLKYLQSIRLRHACILLRETKYSITEIAALCGYEDSNYFSRIFRNHINCSPFEFRKKTSV